MTPLRSSLSIRFVDCSLWSLFISFRIYSNDPLAESLYPCTDVLVCLSPKSQVNEFLHHLRVQHNRQIFYTIIFVQKNTDRWSNKEYDLYPTTNTRYSLARLHSFGYLFDDKYLSNASLRDAMRELAEKDEQCFVQAVQRAIDGLKKCHWLDLTTIFHRNCRSRVSKTPQSVSQTIRSRGIERYWKLSFRTKRIRFMSLWFTSLRVVWRSCPRRKLKDIELYVIHISAAPMISVWFTWNQIHQISITMSIPRWSDTSEVSFNRALN